MPTDIQTEKRLLLDLSARLGQNPFFVQASTGNTSIKIDGTLWIKSSGTWLAEADRNNILVPVSLANALDSLRRDQDPTLKGIDSNAGLRASIETAMHAVLPHRIVIHVHSVNAVAWAIRADAPDRLACLLRGMQWQWIPYVSSGVPLARAVKNAVTEETCAFILGNHGLIVCGESCESAEVTLCEVERRLAITPPLPAGPDHKFLSEVAASGPWTLPDDSVLHVLGTDPLCRSILAGGILYPCQAIFWHTTSPALFTSIPSCRVVNCCDQDILSRPFLIIEERGVLVRQGIDPADYAILRGLAHVVQRTSSSATIRYLTESELTALSVNSGNYRALANRCGRF